MQTVHSIDLLIHYLACTPRFSKFKVLSVAYICGARDFVSVTLGVTSVGSPEKFGPILSFNDASTCLAHYQMNAYNIHPSPQLAPSHSMYVYPRRSPQWLPLIVPRLCAVQGAHPAERPGASPG